MALPVQGWGPQREMTSRDQPAWTAVGACAGHPSVLTNTRESARVAWKTSNPPDADA